MDEADPGSLMAQMNTNENQLIDNNHPPASVLDLEDLVRSATPQNLRTALQSIRN